ncbi:hypothetical protein FEM03_12230 [Phragmitibacter flavus]|uniref:DUF5666 domain-containing protein n=1 Tax=Phragmitibacter flavus TaxID=2576071 RepID=A0A5R8KE06_9BACT|nr:hypothetical protein [Phragmitibacter flavus]TLD70487.1 hypothetical protein FEM03_12230 [Phragmitibacter flavus]
MKKIQATTFAIALLLISNIGAAETKKPTEEKKAAAKTEVAKKEAPKAAEKSKAKKFPYYGQVAAITKRTLTIKTSEEAPERKIAVTAETQIMKNDKPATTDDVVVGQWVGGSVEKNAAGEETAATINLSAKQKKAKPAAKPAAKTEKKPAPKTKAEGETKTPKKTAEPSKKAE